MPPSKFQIVPAQSPSQLETAKTLITAYTKWTNLDLTFQGISSELASLSTEYGPSHGGALYLAYSTDPHHNPTSTSPPQAEETHDPIVLGCIALRALPSTPAHVPPPHGSSCCEMKRLYVTDQARGLGVGRALVDAIVSRARELGYTEMRLDTLPWMEGAIALYRRIGFVDIEPYYETPLEETVFLGLDLR
ncbi:hypothetical protein FE257_010138 [Aspergillus nanangensis]|uniref:N-acetyltransferase domain-containing protein n=1 Tax=Aspergillus nanangensis TaxID=2582783 RepID=A0AAD4GSG0_ASPNN|nr:hypothetical protein FE257_010138 [Aspergillus nanangensis]